MKKLHGRLLLATLLCACGGALDDAARRAQREPLRNPSL